MEQIVIILILVLLIIIALNYKKIKYNKIYKKSLNFIKNIIDEQIKSKDKKKKSRRHRSKKSKHHKKIEEITNDDITIGDVIGENNEIYDNESNVNNNDNNDNISFLTDVSSVDLNSTDNNSINDSKAESVLSFD